MDLNKLSREELEQQLELANSKLKEYELHYQTYYDNSKKIIESEKSFRDIFNNAIDAIYVLDKAGYFIDVNQGAVELYGYAKEELIGKTPALTGAPGMNDMAKVIEMIKLAYEGEPQQFDFWGLRKNGEVFPKLVRLSTGYYFGKKSIFAFAIDMTVQKRAEKLKSTLYRIANAVSTTENMREMYENIRGFLGEIIDTKNFYVALYSKEKDLISFDYFVDSASNYEDGKPATRSFGKGLTEYVITTNQPMFLPKDKQEELYKQGLIERIGEPSEIWFGVPLRVDNEVTGVIAVQSYHDTQKYSMEDLEILSFISEEIAHAIHKKRSEERIKRELEEKGTLLKELYHRTKNNMQVISSMLRMQIRSLGNRMELDENSTHLIQSIFNDVVYKINSMSLVHQKLYQTRDLTRINLKDYIKDLSRLMMQSYSYQHGKIAFEYKLENTYIEIEKAMPLGIVITELISNCFKYAFPNKKSGIILLEIFTDEKKMLNIRIKDNGIGVSDNFNPKGLQSMGLQTVFSLIEYQLRGSINWECDNGLCWSIKLSLNEVIS